MQFFSINIINTSKTYTIAIMANEDIYKDKIKYDNMYL